MTDILIKARSDGKVFRTEMGNLKLAENDQVIFESEQCQEIAVVIKESSEVAESKEKAELIRHMNEKDLEIDQQNKEEATSLLVRCKEIVKKHDLPMELLDADLSFDRKKLTFYFSAPGRVDFRSLVSELAANFQKLIRLQQVGARERAKCMGGIGRCGQSYCCHRFLKGDLEGVTTDMAYDQNLAQMGPNRTTGACGKLMCCLKYELDFYKDAKKNMPAIGSKIKTEKGEGIVVSQCIVRSQVRVELANKTILEVPWKS